VSYFGKRQDNWSPGPNLKQLRTEKKTKSDINQTDTIDVCTERELRLEFCPEAFHRSNTDVLYRDRFMKAIAHTVHLSSTEFWDQFHYLQTPL
jgi:hypothetical protein